MHSVLEVFYDTWHSNMESPSACWNATLSCPLVASYYASLSLVRISFWMLTIPGGVLGTQSKERLVVSYLMLQACISFYSASDKSGAFVFLPCLHVRRSACLIWLSLRFDLCLSLSPTSRGRESNINSLKNKFLEGKLRYNSKVYVSKKIENPCLQGSQGLP